MVELSEPRKMLSQAMPMTSTSLAVDGFSMMEACSSSSGASTPECCG
jgi:hypothetical protein